MEIGLIGLGKMGYNLALNMKDNNIDIKAFARNQETLNKAEKEGIEVYSTIQELVASLKPPRIIWIMVTAGEPVDNIIQELLKYISPKDIVIDGGNSRFADTIRRNEYLEQRGIFYIDAGTSGGIKGARYGACIMAGGADEAINRVEPVFKAICVEDGFLHVGVTGSGHYVKMVHNGIEYGMMQAIGEGFAILKKSGFDMDFQKVAKVWNSGSIIEGYLMQMTQKAFEDNGNLEKILPVIDALGEGQWTVEEAIKLGVSAPVIANALFVRYSSKDYEAFSDKVVAAIRNEFGGHQLHLK